MLAALDALIQNGSGGRSTMVLRQLCELSLKIGPEPAEGATRLIDEIMANVAAAIDEDVVRVLAPELQQLPAVMPVFASTIASRFHEMALRASPVADPAPAEDSESAEIDLDIVDIASTEVPTPVAIDRRAPAGDTAAVPSPIESMLAASPPVIELEIADEPVAILPSPPAAERRAEPRDPEADSANPITMARRATLAELLEIASLPKLPESITNVIVGRGDREAMDRALRNPGAAFARSSLTTLAELAPSDRLLRDALLSRVDLPEGIVERLLPFLSPDAKAAILMAGAPFGEREAQQALTQAAGDLATAYRNGHLMMGLDSCAAMIDEGKMSPAEVIVLLARDARIAELASYMATKLDIRHLTAFNLLSGRLDHGVALLLKAMDADVQASDATMAMRTRCGCREAKETRSGYATAQRYNSEAALDLLRRMDAMQPPTDGETDDGNVDFRSAA
jgi:Uncharacterised protein conserved in bacteria (DUF2336)